MVRKKVVKSRRSRGKEEEFQSDRILTDEELRRYDITLPKDWTKTPPAFIPGAPEGRTKPPSSGMGYVMSPYQQWYCISGDSTIVAFEEDYFRICDIKSFNESHGVNPLGEKSIVEPLNPILVPTFNSEYKLKLSPVKYLTRKKYSGPMVKVKTRYGREITTTGYHSMYVWRITNGEDGLRERTEGKFDVIQATELKVGDWVPIPTHLPVVERCPSTIRISLQDGRYNSGVREAKDLEVTNDLLWIMGFFLAEGYSWHSFKNDQNIYRTSFSSDDYSLDILSNKLQEIGIPYNRIPYRINPNYTSGKFKGRSPSINVSSQILYRLFESVGLFNKRIPEFIFQLPKDKCESFINGFWQGDGNHNSYINHMILSTSNRELAQDFVYLFMRLGRTAGIIKDQRELGIVYNIAAYEENRIHRIGDLHLAKVNEVTITQVENIDVYDIVVPGDENFLAGDGILVHNTMTYGVIPIADMPKYKILYNNQPDIRQAIDLQAFLAMGKGFTVEHPNYDVETFLNELLERTYVNEALFIAVKDALVFGSAFVEILWDEAHTEEVEVEIPPDVMSEISRGVHPGLREFTAMVEKKQIRKTEDGRYFVNAKKIIPFTSEDYVAAKKKNNGKNKNSEDLIKSVRPNIVGLKPLDPVYMRVRRDAFGNVYGYIQWLNFPPTVIRGEDMLHFKYSPTSEGYSSAYGTSILRPLIKNNDLLMQFENDMAIWMHNRVVLPLVIKSGVVDTKSGRLVGWSRDQMADLMRKLNNRTALTTLFLRGDMEVQELRGAAMSLKVDWWLNYLQRRRWVALGVPPVALGIQEPGGRMIGEVMFQEFITRIQKMQNQFGNEIIERLFVPLVAARFGKKAVENKPHVVFRPVVEEDRNLKQARLIQSANSGIISRNEARTGMGYPSIKDPSFDDPIALVMLQAKQEMQLQKSLLKEQTDQQMEVMKEQTKQQMKTMDKQMEVQETTTPLVIEKMKMQIQKGQSDIQRNKMSREKPGGQPPQKSSLDMRPKSLQQKKVGREPKKNIVLDSDNTIHEEFKGALDIVAFNLRNPGDLLAKDIRRDAEVKARQIIETHASDLPKESKDKNVAEFMGIVDELIRRKEELQAL